MRYIYCLALGLNVKIVKMSPELFQLGFSDRVAAQTDLFVKAFVYKNVTPFYDVVMKF